MNDLLLWIFLLSIYNSILFYAKSLGISVILFIVPLMFLIYSTLKKNNKINNKYGLLLTIPILILSINYLLFDNSVFKCLNALLIPSLIILMYILITNKKYDLEIIITDFFKLIFLPLGNINKVYNLISLKLKGKHSINDKQKQKIIALLLVIPISIIVILILSSADSIFGNIFKDVNNYIGKIFNELSLYNVMGRIITIILFFLYTGSVINYLLFNYQKTLIKEKSTFKNDYIMKLLLPILNIIYLVFDFIQVKSLMLHYVSSNINYSEYARSGFFQLMVISIINISLILLSKKFYTKENKNYLKINNIIMVILTLIIIASSFLRMTMYSNEYGYTILRLGVYVSLITETILLIPTIVYIFKDKFNILRYYLIIVIIVYSLTNIINVDYFIAKNNIDKFKNTDKLDLDYLMNYGSDNIPCLIDLYYETDDLDIKNTLLEYFNNINIEINGFQEYNLSKDKAYKTIKKLR